MVCGILFLDGFGGGVVHSVAMAAGTGGVGGEMGKMGTMAPVALW